MHTRDCTPNALTSPLASTNAMTTATPYAAATVGKILEQRLLAGGQIGCIHAADDDAVKAEQFFHFGGEAVFQFVGIRDALPVNLILRGAQNGDQIDGAVVFDGAAKKLEFPARLAFEI